MGSSLLKKEGKAEEMQTKKATLSPHPTRKGKVSVFLKPDLKLRLKKGRLSQKKGGGVRFSNKREIRGLPEAREKAKIRDGTQRKETVLTDDSNSAEDWKIYWTLS